MKRLLMALLALASWPAHSQQIHTLDGRTVIYDYSEAWECHGLVNSSAVLRAYAVELTGEGLIDGAGKLQGAAYAVQGLKRRWDFGESPRSKTTYGYALTIDVEGFGAYFDFSLDKTAKPSSFFRCQPLK